MGIIIFVIFCLFLIIWCLFFEKPKNKIETIIGSIGFFITAIILLFMLNTSPRPLGRDEVSYWSECLNFQRYLSEGIEEYNKHQSTLFPINIDKSGFEKQIDLLVKTKCIRNKDWFEQQTNKQKCTYEIKEGEIICSIHGSRQSDSPRFLKEMAKRKKERDDSNNFRKIMFEGKPFLLILAILSFITSIKFLILTFSLDKKSNDVK